MKIKASFKKLDKKLLFAVFGVLGLILTAVRFYQMFSLTDPATGFFTDKSNVTVPVYYILWFVIVLGSLLLFYMASGCETNAYSARKNIPGAVGSLIMAAGAAYDAYSRFSDMRAGMGGMSLMTYIKADEMRAGMGGMSLMTYIKSLMTYIKAERAHIGFAVVLFAVLTAVVFLIDAAGFITGGSFVSSLKVCHLFPVLWMFCKVVSYFSITVSYLSVTQLMLTIFADGFFMVFLFEYARFLSGIAENESSWLLFASGVTAEVLLAASVLPSLALTVSGKTDMLVSNCPLNCYDIAAVAFVAAAMFTAAVNKNYTPIRLEPADNVPAASEGSSDISADGEE